MCGGIFVGLGVIITIITFLACLGALFSPAWVTYPAVKVVLTLVQSRSEGLFLTCKDFPNGDCEWQNLDKQEDWFMACQWLWVIASFLMAAVAFACIALRFDSCRAKACFSILTSGSLTAFIAALCTIIVYGYHMKDIFDREGSKMYYDWGYYLSIVATAGCLLTFSIFSCAIRCIRSAEL